jgi:parallel beta-helix repeat protein
LKQVRHCIEPDATLLLTARIRLSQDGKVDQTDCAKGVSDNNCMSIYQARLSAKAVGRTSSLWKETSSFGSMLGEETTIALELNFTSQHIDDTNVYEVLQIRGPGPGVDMELLEFTLRYPPREAFPEDDKSVCKELVQSNGDAELLGYSPYPFVSNNQETHLSIVQEPDGNRYFAVTGREFAVQKAGRGTGWRSAGITWDPPPSCIKTHTKYAFEADVRMHSMRLVSSEWKLKGFLPNTRNPIIETISVCPKSKGAWVKCVGSYEPSKEMAQATHFQVVLETDTSSFDVNYDVDNISFRPTEGALDRLILPKTIENLWSPGAEILLNSHTSDWEGHSVRTILSVENHDQEGYVSVRLNEAISQPLTLGSHPFHATEVALLSRNILLDGTDGAHLSILHTPGLTQVIQGVEFLKFGEEGVRDTYPIHFDYCSESANSVISKNTIRQSNQRCIVLDATNDVLVEGNVAFDNKGHCFVVETGTERGNVFKSNLGSYTRSVDKLMPQTGASGKETDKTPATFWIGSPSNSWIDNIASGSAAHGFWLELREAARGPHASEFDVHPSEEELSQFSGNLAHSTKGESLAITGYHPRTTAEIDTFKSFLTEKDHFLISKSSNLAAHGAILDTELESNPFPMTGTKFIAVEPFGNPSELGASETEDHGHAADPTDVFNLQPGAGLS